DLDNGCIQAIKEMDMGRDRREFLTRAAGAVLAAGILSLPAEADEGHDTEGTLYGHGMVWNRNLPGALGELRLSFDLRLNLSAGSGLGTAADPLSPDWGLHFSVESVTHEKRPKGEDRFTLRGAVTEANDPAKVGLPVAIIAETVGDTTAIAI